MRLEGKGKGRMVLLWQFMGCLEADAAKSQGESLNENRSCLYWRQMPWMDVFQLIIKYVSNNNDDYDDDDELKMVETMKMKTTSTYASNTNELGSIGQNSRILFWFCLFLFNEFNI